jgi:hypothetical protein
MASLDLSALSKYTDQLGQSIMKEATLRGRTLDVITVIPGVKYKTSLNLMTDTLAGQIGACSWNASGSTALSQRDITVCPIKVNESICPDELEQYWVGMAMKADGSNNTSAPDAFVQPYVQLKQDGVSAMIDDIFWAGDTATGTGNKKLCNGIMQILTKTSASGTTVPVSKSAITVSNAISILDNSVISVVPTDVINDDKLILFVGYDTFRTIATALKNANYFAYTGAENQGGSFMMPYLGTNITIMAVRGLNGAGQMLLTPAWNLVAGVDLLNDADEFRIFYDENDDEVRFRAKFKIGAQVYFPAYCVVYA